MSHRGEGDVSSRRGRCLTGARAMSHRGEGDVSPRRGWRATVPEAARAHQTPRVEAAAAQVAVSHGQARARRVDEAAAAGIDADVIDAALADAEKYQVPGRELGERHRVRRALLLGGGARNGHADALV